MKVKETQCTANMAWSPAEQHPIYIAAGTAAQQLDATFSTSASLDIYSLDLGKAGLEMDQVASLNTEHRFYKVCWGSQGIKSGDLPNGIIIGGTDEGGITMYDASKILAEEEAVLHTINQHTGAVKALDLNPFQSNLLASGASDSEIFIWDLNNPGTPMTPGAKPKQTDEISCLAWNRQVQHILASTSPCGRCVVWDLKKNEPIIKVTDHSSRLQCKAVAWHPQVATQLVLASEDDRSPIIQMWDLRFATSPLKTLENHQRGVLALSWCQQDADLLMSCAKDNRFLCWNPNSAVPGGEVLYELPSNNQWTFDVQWCPRNPALIASSSFDGYISVYSLMGGSAPSQSQTRQQVDQIASSFPGMDPIQAQPIQQETPAHAPTVILKKPPKWLKRPVGASFGFGGKLLSFQCNRPPPNQPQAPSTSSLFLSQVVTETDLVNRSSCLEEALNGCQLDEFCSKKISASSSPEEAEVWKFLRVNFDNEPRKHFVSLLGHDAHELERKVALATGASLGLTNGSLGDEGVDAEELADRMQDLTSGSTETEAKLSSGSKTPDNLDDGATVFDAIAAGGPIEVENQTEEEQEAALKTPISISRENDSDGLISQAVLTGNFEAAVEVCLHNDQLADAILLAIAGGPELLAKTQRKYFKKTKTNLSRLISAIITKDLKEIVESCELVNWKEALTALLTYSTPKEFAVLCDSLGQRLQTEDGGKRSREACLCYICSGNVEKLATCWSNINPNDLSPLSLQDLVEKVMILRKSVELKTGRKMEVSSPLLAQKLSEYAKLLAAQGNLQIALSYLNNSKESQIVELRDRLQQALYVTAKPAQQTRSAAHNTSNQQARQPQAQQPQVQWGAQRQQNQGVNSFQTNTVSSSQFYTPQTASRTQTAGAYTETQAQVPQLTPVPSNNKPGINKRYPTYPSQGMQQFYAPTGTTNLSQSTGYAPNYAQQNQPQPTQMGVTSNYPGPTPSTSMYNPGVYTPAPEATPQPPMSSYQKPRAARKPADKGWNEPPQVKQKAPAQSFVAPEPITAPIAGGAMEEYPPAAPPGGYMGAPGGMAYNAPPTGHQPTPQVSQQVGGGQGYYNPAQANYSPAPAQNETVTEPETPPAVSKPQEVVKPPLPEAHQVLQDVFDDLTQRCLQAAANNAQTKRKLDDVRKRLNVLYDRLRENYVSPTITQGLHQIAQAMQACDYQTGLRVHTQLVSTGNFSEIGAFMPGLKVLLQVATQLRV